MNFKSFVFPGFQPTDTRMCGCFVRIFWEGKTSPWFLVACFCAMGKTHFVFFLKGFFLSIANVGRIRDARGCNHLLPLDSRRRQGRDLQAHGGSEAGSGGRFETARAELRSSRGFEKMAILRTKIPEDTWNESLLISKHSMHLSDQLDRKESTLNQAWAGDEKAFQKDSKFCTFLVALLTQKNLSSEMSSTYMRFLKENPLPPAELRRREGSPQKRWHLGWWKDFFIFCWLGSSWRLGIEFEENIPKTLKLESKSRMETNVVFPGLEGAWTEILPKIRDVKIVPGDFKAVTTCRWSHRSAYHQQLFQKVSRITIPKKGHPKVTSRIARLYKWNCPYITYQKTGEGCIPPPGFCLGCLHFLGGVPSKLSQDLMDFSGRKKRVYDQTNPCESQLPHNPPPKELEEFFGWWRNLEKKNMFFVCVSIEA